MTVSHTAFLGLSIHLEDAVVVRGLDARQRIELFARHLLEELLGNAFSVRVAIGTGQAQQGTVVPNAAEVETPSVDSDGIQGNMTFSKLLQAFEEVLVDAIDIPIVLTADFEGLVGEAVDLFHAESAVGEGAQDGASAGGAAVESQETIGFHV